MSKNEFSELDTAALADAPVCVATEETAPLMVAAAERFKHLLRELEDATVTNPRPNKIRFKDRVEVYKDARDLYGTYIQMYVALEELSEAQKEICKMLRGKGDFNHLAEEVADAVIVLEQVCMIFDIHKQVCEHMDAKVIRLKENIEKDKADEDRIAREVAQW